MRCTPDRGYPSDWARISEKIRARARGQCECCGECGLHSGRRCEERNGEAARHARGRIILTVAHLDHHPPNVMPRNLLALCQRCHLRYDSHDRRHRGQMDLPLDPPEPRG